jgi:hypothetical protein
MRCLMPDPEILNVLEESYGRSSNIYENMVFVVTSSPGGRDTFALLYDWMRHYGHLFHEGIVPPDPKAAWEWQFTDPPYNQNVGPDTTG